MQNEKNQRKIAKDDVIRFILKEVMKEKRKVESQSELTALVNMRFSKAENVCSVSPERLRLIAVETPEIRVLTKTRQGRAHGKCPVCFHTLKKRKMKNLKGKSIVYGYFCKNCGFLSSEGESVPGKYAFEYMK